MNGRFAENFDNVERIPNEPIPIRPRIADAGEYPIEALSPKLQGAAIAIMDKTLAPAAVCAQSVLAAAALAIQPYINVVLPTGEEVPVSGNFVTVAGSSERKSSADKLALHAVREREAEMQRDFVSAQASFQIEQAAYKAARKKAETGSKNRNQIRDDIDACGPEPLAPPTPLLLADDITIQGLHKLLAEAMPSLGLFSDEGGQMLGGYSMQDENRVATGAALSKLWDGAPVKRVRGTDGFTILRGRRLSCHLMIQERIAKRLFGDPELASQGLLSRMLPCHPKTTRGTRFWKESAEGSQQALERYGTRLYALLSSPMPMDPVTRELSPRSICLSADARNLFIQWHDAVEADLGPGGRFEGIVGFAGKLPEHSVRLAAIMSCFEDRNVQEVSDKALAAGIKLAQFYAAEALRLYGVGAADEDSEHADVIIQWVRSQQLKVVGKRFLSRYGPGRPMTAKQRERAIDLLVQMNHLVPIANTAEITFKGKTTRARDAFTVIAEESEEAA